LKCRRIPNVSGLLARASLPLFYPPVGLDVSSDWPRKVSRRVLVGNIGYSSDVFCHASAIFSTRPERLAAGQSIRGGRVHRCRIARRRRGRHGRQRLFVRGGQRPHISDQEVASSESMGRAADQTVKKAKVAIARKIAVIPHCIRVDGTSFEWAANGCLI
jgi:hypothetical protein